MEQNYFSKLNDINVSEKVEKKNGLSYLSWAWAWGEVKKAHPTAQYKVYENSDGWNYFTDGRTCWVKVSVTINDIEHIEYLPVMDVRNRSIPVESVTSFDVNKTIQRAITKACARHGLGLYIYAGEDLPENELTEAPKDDKQPAQTPIELPTMAQVKELKDLGGTLEQVATYFKTTKDKVTKQQVQQLIDKKKRIIAKQKAAEEEAAKQAQAQKEAEGLFGAPPSDEPDFSAPEWQ